MAGKKTKTLTPEHLAALERGRQSGRAVKAYLNWLTEQATRPRTRRRSTEDLQQALNELEVAIAKESSPIQKLGLIQQRIDTQHELDHTTQGDDVDTEALKAAFIEHAAAYSTAKNISYQAWREIGVPAAVLKTAGIAQTRRPSPT